MPSALAFKVITLANSSSLPAMASATTTAASFADLVTKPPDRVLNGDGLIGLKAELRGVLNGRSGRDLQRCVRLELAAVKLLEK